MRISKKIVTFMVLLAVIIVSATLISTANEKNIVSYCTYTVTDGKATITDVDESISGKVVVPSIIDDYEVVAIAANAFSNCDEVTSIRVPDSVTSIGQGAFKGMNSLESITLPFVGSTTSASGLSSVFGYIFGYTYEYLSSALTPNVPEETIYQYSSPAKYGNNHYYYYIPQTLRKVTITNDVDIPDYAFYNCSFLTEINIPDVTTSIGNYAFYNCSEITRFNVPEGVAIIPNSAFYNCSKLKEIILPSTVERIGQYAFYNCTELESVSLSATTKIIDGYAFKDCTALKNIELSSGLETISSYAFQNCTALTEIVIPDSVTSVGDSAFRGAHSLESITLPFVGNTTSASGLSSVFGYIFGYTYEYLSSALTPNVPEKTIYQYSSPAQWGNYHYYYYIPQTLRKVTITKDIDIPYRAFSNCSFLIEINIPDTATSIGNEAFYNCSEITRFNVPEGVAIIPDSAFYNCSNLKEIILPGTVETIGQYAFYNCTGLESVSLSTATKIIDSYAFKDCTALKNIELSNGLETISSFAFQNCTSLTEIIIPDSVTSVSDCAFQGVDSLESIKLPFVGNTTSASGLSSVFGSIFGYTYEYKSSAFTPNPPEETTYQYSSPAQWGNYHYYYYIPQTLRKVTITTDADIPAKAFYNCSFLTEINIPDTVTSFGEYAFYNCSGIVSLEITEYLTSIGGNAFLNCSNLTVYGYRDSYADTYCTTNNVPFVAYDGIVSIAVKQLPVNMQYIGRSVDTMGFILTATLKDGTTVDFNTGYTLEPEMLTVEGANEVKVKFAGLETSFIANTSGIKSIEVADMPEKTEYFEGDVVDATGLTLNVTYNDDSTALICGGYDVITTTLDVPGTAAVEIDYNGIRTSYNVTVKEVVMVDWILYKAPNKLTYDIGEYINVSGVVIRENYNNGTYVDVTSGFTCTPESFDRTGEFEVTVEYKGLTATFVVNVTEKVHEHTYKTTVIKAVTCLEDGIDLYSCGCGYSYEETVTAPGHSYNKVVTPPTCQTAGYTTYTCSRCSDTYVGDEDNNLRHWGGTATCEDKAICSTCGVEYGEPNTDNHKTVIIDKAVEATCTTTGLTEGSHCEACGVVIKEQKEIKVLGHSYTDWTITKNATIFEDGEKYRTCTVCQYVETIVIEKIVIDTEYNENYGIANFTVVDATTKTPIKNASIFVSTDVEGESTFYTDESGKVSIVLPVGENIITAHSKGIISRTLTIDIVHGENEIPAIGLSSSPIVEAELVTTPMTKEEIEDAGIDTSAPENNNVIKYEVTFEFTATEPEEGEEPKKETIKETFYVNGNGDHFYQNNNTTHEIFGKPVTIHPTERFYLIITGDIIWLKEMFHVQLYAYNNSNTDWIEDAVATLNLPEGLSLADMSEGEQTLSQQMGTIPEGGQADCEWYVRGDKKGIYDLTAKLEGRIMPFNEDFSNEYTAEEAIKVYSGKAFNITFEVPSITYCGDEYPVKIILKNVSDRPIYNVAHVLTGISQTKVTHYSNGEVVEEIYVKETLDKAKFVDEFGPGDEIVLEVNAKILFESEKYKDCFFELVDIIFGAKELGDAINNNFGFPSEHDWGEWETVKKPTCGEAGEEKRVCKNNEVHIETREIETLPHDWDDGVINPVSTCKDHGIKTYICKNDASHTKTELVPLDKDNHIGETYIKGAKEISCEEDGYTGNIHCLGCDVKLSGGEIIPAHGHDYHKIDAKSKAPDYGVAGYDYYECSYDASHNYTVEIAPLVKTTFTATFVTTAPFFKEDKIVAEVTFTQGDKFVAEPPVDKYDNYTFAWDEYELKDKDIVIYGRYTEIEINDVTEPDAEKKVEYNNGVVNITLEAKSDSKNIKILSEKTKPVDVILVLDQSGSMAETLSSNRKTKRDALVECANDFVNEIYENAVATGAQHRVAVVGFSYSDYNGGNYKNTGILATNNGSSVNYKSLKSSHYASALIPVVAANGINANITKGINSVVADGATSAHLGLEMANNIFAVTAKEADRERIVLFITDGTPTSWGEETDLVKTTAAKAITEAYELKNSHGAKVYSIGVHANADPTANFTSDMYGVKTDNRDTFKSYDFNRFLHAVSSNYKEAGSIVVSEMGEGSKSSGYYLGVQDTSKLSEIFSKILLSSVYEVKTFDKVTIVDTVSKEFTLTIEQETEMRERLIKELGIRNEDITVTRNDDGTTTLRFENVRAQKIYNDDGSSYYSAKVAFNVSADKDSLGLTEVNTNTEDAGVELDGETIDKFTVPSVTLEPDRKLVVFTVNGVVYRIEEAKLGDNIVAPESALAEWNIPEDTVVDGDYVVFEANVVDSTEYTVTWVSENSKFTETYSFGEEIIIPEAAEKNGYEFLKWSPGVPATMPNYNITFTAIYTPKHTHKYNKTYSYGKCTEGIVTVYECACGDSYEETAEATKHSAKAVVEQTNDGTLIEKVNCQVCGVTNSLQLTYKVTYRDGWWNTAVLDLTLLENDVSVQPDGTLEIRFYVGENINKNYTVYRIDENGNKTSYTPRKENGYLIFDADHFSFYVVAELDEETGEVVEDMSYSEVYCISNGHSEEIVQGKAATCTSTGLTDGSKCSVCGEIITAQQKIDKLSHSESEWIIDEDSTCAKEGSKHKVCTVCKNTVKTETIANKAHAESSWIETKAATCSENGERITQCTVCKTTIKSESIGKTAHNYNGDSKCDDCSDECDHMCHKSGFMGFIWKIVRFFWKLFKMNLNCECGVKHY